jgi:hypothetical protein
MTIIIPWIALLLAAIWLVVQGRKAKEEEKRHKEKQQKEKFKDMARAELFDKALRSHMERELTPEGAAGAMVGPGQISRPPRYNA